MDQFEYIMVLVSIIIGLGIAHILVGIGGIIDRLSGHGPPLKLSLAHAAWLGTIFTWMILFWWWEYRFSVLEPLWTVRLYFFLVLYAVVLFLLAVILVLRNWDGIGDLGNYLIERRWSFYSLFFVVSVIDLCDSLLKGGWDYVADLGPVSWTFSAVAIPIWLIGMRSRRRIHHSVMAVGFFILQLAVGLETLPILGF
jgi:hypothetical protein